MTPGLADPMSALWMRLNGLQVLRSPWRPSLSWIGVDPQVRPDRLQVLLSSPAARAVFDAVETLDDSAGAWLETVARTNASRAEAAARWTVLANLTAPVGVLATLGQIFPEAAAETLASPTAVTALLAVVVCSIAPSVAYSLVQARRADALRDLVVLARARAGAAAVSVS